jgi:hypothetical protein
MTPVGFKPTISAGERPQIHALDRPATRTGNKNMKDRKFYFQLISTKKLNKATSASVLGV